MNFKAVALAGVALAFSASVADAANIRPYISAKVGATSTHVDIKHTEKFDKTKIFASGAFGLDFANRFRAELEYTYRDEADEKNADGTNKFKNQSGFVNFYYDLPVKWAVVPYVGVGAGMSRIEGSVKTATENVKKTKNTFSWNVGAGFAWKISKSFAMDFGYRFVMPGEWKAEGVKAEFKNHEFFGGIRYTF